MSNSSQHRFHRFQFSLRTWLIVTATAAITIGIAGPPVWQEVKLYLTPPEPIKKQAPLKSAFEPEPSLPDFWITYPNIEPMPLQMSREEFANDFLAREPMLIEKLPADPAVTIRDDSVLLTYECADMLCNITVEKGIWVWRHYRQRRSDRLRGLVSD